MQVKSIAKHSAILSTYIQLPFVIKIFVLLFEWALKTGFNVFHNCCQLITFGNSLDPDQVKHFVVSDLVSKFLTLRLYS